MTRSLSEPVGLSGLSANGGEKDNAVDELRWPRKWVGRGVAQ
jgi:hypothetical protein